MKTLEELTKEVNIIKSLTEKTKSGKIEWNFRDGLYDGYKAYIKTTSSCLDDIGIYIILTDRYASLSCLHHGSTFMEVKNLIKNDYDNEYGDYKDEIINLIKNLYREIKNSPKITELSVNKIIEKQESMDKATDFLTNL